MLTIRKRKVWGKTKVKVKVDKERRQQRYVGETGENLTNRKVIQPWRLSHTFHSPINTHQLSEIDIEWDTGRESEREEAKEGEEQYVSLLMNKLYGGDKLKFNKV